MKKKKLETYDLCSKKIFFVIFVNLSALCVSNQIKIKEHPHGSR
jgi:hypothetical protein